MTGEIQRQTRSLAVAGPSTGQWESCPDHLDGRNRTAPVNDDRFDAFVQADKLRLEHGHWRGALGRLMIGTRRGMLGNRIWKIVPNRNGPPAVTS